MLLRHQQEQVSLRRAAKAAQLQLCPMAAPLIKEETFIFTYGGGLQQECDDAEEVDISIINCELHKDCSGVPIQPFLLEEILKGPVN